MKQLEKGSRDTEVARKEVETRNAPPLEIRFLGGGLKGKAKAQEEHNKKLE